MHAAHLHGVLQLVLELVRVYLHALRAAAVDHGDEGAADEHAVSPQRQSLEHVQTRADAAVHEDLHPAAHGVGDGGQHLRGGGALVQHTAAVVGHHDAGGAGLHGLAGACGGHDALEDKGLARKCNDLPQLLNRLAAGGRGAVLQEGQSCGVDVHGHGQGLGLADLLQLAKQSVPVPGLHRGHAAALSGPDGLQRALHDAVVDAVAGTGQNAGTAAGSHQQIVVGRVVIFVAVMHFHGTHGGGQHRQAQLRAEEIEGGVGGAVVADGVHLHAELLPLLVVALEGDAQTLGAGAGDGIAAGLAVTYGAGLAVRAHTGAGCLQNLVVVHGIAPLPIIWHIVTP